MKERTTQLILVLIAGLLAANLFRSSPAVAVAQSAQAVPDILRAKMIELVDEKGQARAQLKVEPDGEVVFRLRDRSGTIRVKLAASESGAGLLLLDDATEPAVHLLAKPGSTSMTLAEKGKQKRTIAP